MKSLLRRKPLWIVVFVIVVAGVAVLVTWSLRRERFPEGTLFVPRDVATLSEALRLAMPGATIVLDARRGPYSGPVVLSTEGVTLTATRGRAALVGEDEPVVSLRADSTTAKHLDIRGASVGVAVEGTGCRVEDVRAFGGEVAVLLSGSRQGMLERLTITGGRTGVAVLASSGNVLRSLAIRGCDQTGIRLEKARANEVHDASVDGAATGVSVEESEDNAFVGLSVTGASIVGYEVLGGRSNTLEASQIRSSRVGASLERTDESQIGHCRIASTQDAGVSLVEAQRSRLERNAVSPAAGDGVRIAGGKENAVLDGRLSKCQGAAVRIDASDANLVARNEITSGRIGISLVRSSENRLLDNTIVRSGTAGILLLEARRNRLLDNRVEGATSGITLVGAAGNSILRSVVDHCTLSGLALANHCQGNDLSENRITRASVGLVAATSSRDTIQGNEVSKCGAGIVLYAPGFGVRIAGNRLVGNDVGLQWQAALDERRTALPLLGVSVVREPSGGTPIVVSNLFARNRRLDVENSTSELLYAGGNRWGDGEAAVSGAVHLPGSAWKGTVVIAAGRDLVDLVLGEALAGVLSEAGFRVVELAGLGEPEKLLAAMEAGDVDIAWWVGAAPPAGAAAYWSVPADLRWDLIVPAQTARELDVASISAFVGSRGAEGREIAVPSEIPGDTQKRFADAYGVSAKALRQTATRDEAEALLKFGSVAAALLQNVEETATVGGFVRLEDNAFVLPGKPIGVVVARDALLRLPEVEETFARLSPRLTEQALRSLASRVRLLHREPFDVVMEFLGNEGLIQ